MIGTLVLTILSAGLAPAPPEPGAAVAPMALHLDFERRIDGRSERPMRADEAGHADDRRPRTGGSGSGAGVDGPPTFTQSNGSHPGSGSMGPPGGFNLPPEAGPGPENLKFYVIHIGGFGKGTKTGFWEEFMVYAPSPANPRPLLMIFHKWGVGWADARDNTEFFNEGIRRKWNVMCQLGASGVHVSSIPSQQNTAVAMGWVLDNFNVDKERLYAVGFSMGGGAAGNYAARHLDPKDHMIAAFVDHTGMISHADTYANTQNGHPVFEFWYGMPPDPFEMARTSLVEFDPQTLVVNTQNDMARNLTHVPTKVMYASNEPAGTAYLTVQNQVFRQHLASLGGTVVEEEVPFTGHEWSMLDEKAVCSWLANWTLRIPKNADTLADEDGTYFYFNVVQDTPGAFTPFSWSINETLNKVLVWKTENLQRISVDVVGAGLDVGQTLQVVLKANDGLADECRVKGWPLLPIEVRRDGVPQLIDTTWSYNSVAQLLIINEFDPATHIWEIDP
jgi:pimeloyl-ACP methyl ester carboxylesterase